LYYQLFSFVLCVVFVIFVFLNSLENPQQRARHSTSNAWNLSLYQVEITM
jgi:hypothetical protein